MYAKWWHGTYNHVKLEADVAESLLRTGWTGVDGSSPHIHPGVYKSEFPCSSICNDGEVLLVSMRGSKLSIGLRDHRKYGYAYQFANKLGAKIGRLMREQNKNVFYINGSFSKHTDDMGYGVGGVANECFYKELKQGLRHGYIGEEKESYFYNTKELDQFYCIDVPEANVIVFTVCADSDKAYAVNCLANEMAKTIAAEKGLYNVNSNKHSFR